MRSKLFISLLILPLGLITLSGVAQAKTPSYSLGVHQGSTNKTVAYASKTKKLTPEQQQQIQQVMDKLKQDKQKLVQDRKDYKKNPSNALKQAIAADQAIIKQDMAELKSLKKQFKV